MQENVVELIRELMKTQQMSIRKISARIAKEHGGSALGYTQQINRILNDSDYDPNFSTVQKVLAALNCSFWQLTTTQTNFDFKAIEGRLDRLETEIADLKLAVDQLRGSVEGLVQELRPNQAKVKQQSAPIHSSS
jgi:transcriptional regulator with XRE-family HTH domain